MELILTLLFVGILIFVLSGTFRRWLLMLVLQRVQRRMQEQMRQQGMGGQSRSSQPDDRASDASRRSKLDMDEIEAKRFARTDSDDYVDFEELPKDK